MSVGFPQEWFVNVPEDGCICKICDGVANEPKQCMIGHLFCSYCLEIYSKIKGNANKCPTCNKTGSLGDKSPNLFASKVISTLPVFCSCHENNDTKNECGWTGKLIDRESRECEHVPIACPLQENGLCNSNCSGVIQHNQLSAHINEQGNKVEIVLTLVQQVRDLKHELSVLKSQTIAPVDQDVLITEKRKSPRVLDMPVVREDSSKRTKVETGSSKHQTTKVSSLVVKEKETVTEPEPAKVWAQCSTCSKWRTLPSHIDSSKLPKIWTCKMNRYDKNKNFCDAPEDSYSDEETNSEGGSDGDEEETQVDSESGQLTSKKAVPRVRVAASQNNKRKLARETVSPAPVSKATNKRAAPSVETRQHPSLPVVSSVPVLAITSSSSSSNRRSAHKSPIITANSITWIEPNISSSGRIAVTTALEINRNAASALSTQFDLPLVELEDAEGVYKGQIFEGQRHGKGWNIRPDSEAFQGDYLNGVMTGYGVYTYSHGDRYEGFWLNGAADGQGVYWTSENGSVYAGSYVVDQREGYGEMHWGDGGYHKGQWKAGIECGHGERKYAGSNDIWAGETARRSWMGNLLLGGRSPPRKLGSEDWCVYWCIVANTLDF